MRIDMSRAIEESVRLSYRTSSMLDSQIINGDPIKVSKEISDDAVFGK